MEEKSQGNIPFWLIGLVSMAVPALVAFLFFLDGKLSLGDFVYQLPHFHGVLNSLTTLVLISALIAVKKGNISAHKALMTSAVCMGAIFLISYVTYHSSDGSSVIYGDANRDGVLSDDEGALVPYRDTYLTVLLSHIGTSLFALPLVLISFIHALRGNFQRHKAFVKFAFPVWLYVSITGVIVYLMMRPYYLIG